MREFLKGRKTYIVAALMFLVALVDVLSGDMTIAEFFKSPELIRVLEALGLISIRAGIAKGGK